MWDSSLWLPRTRSDFCHEGPSGPCPYGAVFARREAFPFPDKSMQKQHILNEIKRTAAANGGTPLGKGRFYQETSIKEADWLGRYWSRWSDALREAGFSPNTLQEAYPEEELLARLATLCRELGRLPVRGELRLKRRADPSFPSDKVFDRFGTKAQVVAKLAEYCSTRSDLADVAALCAPITETVLPESDDESAPEPEIGFVYLLRSGRHYKIGRSNAAGRRERELAIQLPEKASRVHTIRTDDPVGIESYWHTRFESKRLNGEWFALNAADVKAFRRRKFM